MDEHKSVRDQDLGRGRLDEAILTRFLDFGVRVVRVTGELEKLNCSPRIIAQLIGSGTSPGAQMFEAHEALSAADFKKSVGIAVKELSETRYWLRLIIRVGWLNQPRLEELLDETGQLIRITKAMVARTRGKRR